jgi:hypothetical protein
MARSITRTDNDHTASKVALRVEAVLRLGDPRPIWDLVRDQLPEGWTVALYRADQQHRRAGTLKINNERLLEVLDLARFDLIDLDAYGWPARQLKTVAARAPDKMVLTTRIVRTLGNVPKLILEDLGIQIPTGGPGTLYLKMADELWEAWLYRLGYRTSRMLRFDHNEDPEFRDQTHQVKRYELLIP